MSRLTDDEESYFALKWIVVAIMVAAVWLLVVSVAVTDAAPWTFAVAITVGAGLAFIVDVWRLS